MTSKTWAKKGRDIRIYRYLWVNWARTKDAHPAMFPSWNADEILAQTGKELDMSTEEVRRGVNNLVQRGLLSRWEDELVTTTLPRLDTMMPLARRDQDALRIAPGNGLVRAYLGEVLDYLRRVDAEKWILPHAAFVGAREGDESLEVWYDESLGNRPEARALVLSTGAIQLVWSDGTLIHEITPSNLRRLERVLTAAQKVVAARQEDRRSKAEGERQRRGPPANPDALTGIESQMLHAVYLPRDRGLEIAEDKLLEIGVRGGLTLNGARACVRKLVRLNRIAIDPRSGLVRSVPADWHRSGLEPEINLSE